MFEIHPEMTKQEAKDDRDCLRGWILRIVVFALALICVVVATKAYAQESMVAGDAQFTLRLFQKPCKTNEVLKYLREHVRPLYQESILVWGGRTLKSCWRLTDDKKAVMSVDEAGDALQPPIPVEVFRADDAGA